LQLQNIIKINKDTKTECLSDITNSKSRPTISLSLSLLHYFYNGSEKCISQISLKLFFESRFSREVMTKLIKKQSGTGERPIILPPLNFRETSEDTLN